MVVGHDWRNVWQDYCMSRTHPEDAQIWRKLKVGAKGRNRNRCLLLLMFDPAVKAECRGD